MKTKHCPLPACDYVAKDKQVFVFLPSLSWMLYVANWYCLYKQKIRKMWFCIFLFDIKIKYLTLFFHS
jgi:hypothetical protein